MILISVPYDKLLIKRKVSVSPRGGFSEIHGVGIGGGVGWRRLVGLLRVGNGDRWGDGDRWGWWYWMGW